MAQLLLRRLFALCLTQAGRVLKINKNVLRLSFDPSCTPAQLAARLQHTLLYVRWVLSPLLQAAVASVVAESARREAGGPADATAAASSAAATAAAAAAATAATCWADAGCIVWLPKDVVKEMFDAALISRPKSVICTLPPPSSCGSSFLKL